MAHLGDFNAAIAELDPAEERDTFTFMGERFEVVGIAPPILTFQLGAAFTGKIPMDEALASMWEVWRVSLDQPDAEPGEPEPVRQFDRFFRVAVEKRAHEETLVKLAIAIYEGRAKRPTVEPRGSIPGLSSTSPSSNPSPSKYSDPELRNLRPVREVLAG